MGREGSRRWAGKGVGVVATRLEGRESIEGWASEWSRVAGEGSYD